MTCRPWCTDHLLNTRAGIDICLGPEITLDFGYHGDHAVACHRVVTDLSQFTANTNPAIMLTVNAEPVADLDKHQAAAIAWALLAQVAQADGDPTLADYYRSRADEHSAAATIRSTR